MIIRSDARIARKKMVTRTLRNVGTLRVAFYEFKARTCHTERKCRRKILIKAWSHDLKSGPNNTLVLKKSVLHCVCDEQVTGGSQHKYTLSCFRKIFEKPAFEFTISIAHNAQIVFVHLHRRAIDLLLLIEPCVTVWAKRDQVFE